MAEIAASTQLPLKTQAWRFIVTGGLSAVVDFGLYVSLLHLGLQVNIAKSLSFIADNNAKKEIPANYAWPTLLIDKTNIDSDETKKYGLWSLQVSQ